MVRPVAVAASVVVARGGGGVLVVGRAELLASTQPRIGATTSVRARAVLCVVVGMPVAVVTLHAVIVAERCATPFVASAAAAVAAVLLLGVMMRWGSGSSCGGGTP